MKAKKTIKQLILSFENLESIVIPGEAVQMIKIKFTSKERRACDKFYLELNGAMLGHMYVDPEDPSYTVRIDERILYNDMDFATIVFNNGEKIQCNIPFAEYFDPGTNSLMTTEIESQYMGHSITGLLPRELLDQESKVANYSEKLIIKVN